MQTPSGGVQMPQLALQQTWPAAPVEAPQGTPPVSPTQRAIPSPCWQWVPVGQSIDAQVVESSMHCGIGGHGARMHCTWMTSQWVPAAQSASPQVRVDATGDVAVSPPVDPSSAGSAPPPPPHAIKQDNTRTRALDIPPR